MGKRDPRIDDYIARSAEFARPILVHFREIVHTACPQVEETMKWSMPSFEYHGILCNMASFKAHCAIGFWKGALLFEHSGTPGEAMGHLGRITKLADLPPKGPPPAGEGSGSAERGGRCHPPGEKGEDREATGRDSRRSRRGAQEEQEGAGDVRGVSAESSPRVHRVDHRGEDRGHSFATAGTGGRVDVRREIAQLEV